MVLTRIFSGARHAPATQAPPAPLPLEQLRQHLRDTLHDCSDTEARRAIFKINNAKTPSELWLLRCDLHQCISRVHSQAEAASRINALLASFRGWVPVAQLTHI